MLTFVNVDAATVQTKMKCENPLKLKLFKEAFVNYMNTVFSLQ